VREGDRKIALDRLRENYYTPSSNDTEMPDEIMQETKKPKGLAKIWREIKRAFRKSNSLICLDKLLSSRNNNVRNVSYLQTYQQAKQWIERYTVPSEGISVSSSRRWSYPEVTGYYIPTLLDWGMKDLALRYGKWLLTIQNDDGSWNDPRGKSPYVFDTGQILRGLHALADEYLEFKQPLLKGCDWIKSRQLESGRITTPDTSMWGHGLSESIHLYAIAPLLWAAEKFDRPDLKTVVEKALQYYIGERKDFRYNCLSHFHAYEIDGIIELGRTDLAQNAMKEIAALQRKNGSVPGYPGQAGVCSTGLFQYAVIWYKLGEMDRADRAFEYACSLQNPSGGWFGSYGKCDNYFVDAEIAWAVKYFLDAFHLKLRCNFDAVFDSFLPFIAETDGRFQLVRNNVPSSAGAKVLDCGSGKGRYINRLVKEFPHLEFYAMDLSPISHRFLEPGITKGVGSLLRTGFPDDSFDFVYLSEVLEHAVDLDSAVAELTRIVKPGGKLLIIDKNLDRLGFMKICPWEQWFGAETLKRLLTDHGCEVEIVRNIPYDDKDGSDALFLCWIATRAKDKSAVRVRN